MPVAVSTTVTSDNKEMKLKIADLEEQIEELNDEISYNESINQEKLAAAHAENYKLKCRVHALELSEVGLKAINEYLLAHPADIPLPINDESQQCGCCGEVKALDQFGDAEDDDSE